MSSSRKNFSTCYRNVKDAEKDYSQFAVGKIFEKQYKGRDCNSSVFIKVLFCALCHVQSLFAVCRNLQNTPSDHAIATAILKTLPEYTRLQKLINASLAEQLPKKLFIKSKRLAIDLVLIPYHGTNYRNINEIYRSQPKSGTSHFHAYATVCLLHKGFRYTVALSLVVKRLLRQCRSIGLKCKLLLLDRGFYSVNVILYLKHAQVPFVMPVIARGKNEENRTFLRFTESFRDEPGGFSKRTGNDSGSKRVIDKCTSVAFEPVRKSRN